MIRQTISTLFLIGLANLALSQTLKTFKGTVDYKFHLSSTNAIKPVERSAFEREMSPYLIKIDLLSSYYKALKKGDTLAAEKFLNSDSFLSKKDAFTLAYMYSLARMKQLGILYKPCVQVNDDSGESKIIVCSDRQQKEFIKHANSKQYVLRCEYIGDLITNNIQVYNLVSYK